jgi:hypothetical protein
MRTKTFKIVAVVFVFALLSAVLVFAGGMKGTAYKGWLVDQLCAMAPDSVAADGVDLKVSPEMHSLHCALMPPCIASGYGIYVQKDGGGYEFYKFDKKGSALAEEYLKKTSKQDRIGVEVTGTMKGDIIRVKTLSESMM